MRTFTRREILLLVLLVCVTAVFAIQIAQMRTVDEPQPYPLLEPSLSTMSVDDFLSYQSRIKVTYKILRADFERIVNESNGTYSIYFEDLSSGANVGIDERTEYTPRSLFKVPTAIAVLKAVEEGEVSLNQTVVLTDGMLDNQYGQLFTKGAGYQITVAELLRLSVAESDNTANLALRSVVPFERIEEARLATGVPYPKPDVINYSISPKSYAAVMRSLYLSGYLRRPYSEYVLELLSQSVHDDLLVAGVPVGVTVAHKIGEDLPEGQYHDCGIVYHPERPYILCIMSKGITRAEAQHTIPQLSRAAYEGASRPTAHRQ